MTPYTDIAGFIAWIKSLGPINLSSTKAGPTTIANADKTGQAIIDAAAAGNPANNPLSAYGPIGGISQATGMAQQFGLIPQKTPAAPKLTPAQQQIELQKYNEKVSALNQRIKDGDTTLELQQERLALVTERNKITTDINNLNTPKPANYEVLREAQRRGIEETTFNINGNNREIDRLKAELPKLKDQEKINAQQEIRRLEQDNRIQKANQAQHETNRDSINLQETTAIQRLEMDKRLAALDEKIAAFDSKTLKTNEVTQREDLVRQRDEIIKEKSLAEQAFAADSQKKPSIFKRLFGQDPQQEATAKKLKGFYDDLDKGRVGLDSNGRLARDYSGEFTKPLAPEDVKYVKKQAYEEYRKSEAGQISTGKAVGGGITSVTSGFGWYASFKDMFSKGKFTWQGALGAGLSFGGLYSGLRMVATSNLANVLSAYGGAHGGLLGGMSTGLSKVIAFAASGWGMLAIAGGLAALAYFTRNKQTETQKALNEFDGLTVWHKGPVLMLTSAVALAGMGYNLDMPNGKSYKEIPIPSVTLKSAMKDSLMTDTNQPYAGSGLPYNTPIVIPGGDSDQMVLISRGGVQNGRAQDLMRVYKLGPGLKFKAPDNPNGLYIEATVEGPDGELRGNPQAMNETGHLLRACGAIGDVKKKEACIQAAAAANKKVESGY